MKTRYLLLLSLALAGCSTPEQRIDRLNDDLRTGRITMAEYNLKYRKLDELRLKETRENFMR